MSAETKTPAEIDEAVDVIAGQYRDPDVARFAINDFRDWLRGEGMSTSLAARFADLPAGSSS